MKIYTGYFAKLKNYPNPISIAGYMPKGINIPTYKELAPKKEWFFKWKNQVKEVDNHDFSSLALISIYKNLKEDYIKLYNETVLKNLTPEKIFTFLH